MGWGGSDLGGSTFQQRGRPSSSSHPLPVFVGCQAPGLYLCTLPTGMWGIWTLVNWAEWKGLSTLPGVGLLPGIWVLPDGRCLPPAAAQAELRFSLSLHMVRASLAAHRAGGCVCVLSS